MTNSRCVVSVITPLYNTEKYIAECIDSVLNQTLKDVEMLVVDDGSRDRSAEIVVTIARRDSRVRLLQHPGGVNLGVSRTRRLGIMEASGDYIAYLDADDAFEPTKLERQVDLLKSHPQCLLCHTAIKAMAAPAEDLERSKLIESQAQEMTDYFNGFRPQLLEYTFLELPEALRSNIICNSSVLARTEAIRSAPAATEQMFQYEDWVQWVLLSAKGPFVYTPEPLTRYRLHSESSSFSIYKNLLRHLYSQIEFLLSVNVLTDDTKIKARAESELIYCVSRIRGIYENQTHGVAGGSVDAPTQSPGNTLESAWAKSAIQLQSEVNDLKETVRSLSATIATIRSSRVYQGLSKIRKVLRKK